MRTYVYTRARNFNRGPIELWDDVFSAEVFEIVDFIYFLY